jgi:hypothetical protein
MRTDPPVVDLVSAARLLTKWMQDPKMSPIEFGYALDMWVAVTGHTTDPDLPEYEQGLEDALALAVRLADPTPDPGFTVTAVEVVRGEVL